MIRWGTNGLGLLMLAGALVAGPALWGFNHLAYLSPAWQCIEILLVLLLLWPHAQTRLARLFSPAVHDWIFSMRRGVVVIPLLAGGLFFILSTRTHFLGDGYLLLDLISKNSEFRPTNSFGFAALFWIRPLFKSGAGQALAVYKTVSVLAGVGGMALILILLRRTSWEPQRRLLFLCLHFTGAASLLYFGYVENYSVLYTLLSAFTLAGVLYAEGALPIFVPAALFAFAVAAHLSALLAAPALLVMAWARAGEGRWRNLGRAAAPVTLVLVGLSAYLFVHEGGASGVVKSLRTDLNLGSPFRPLFGSRGIVSVRTALDSINWFLLVAPVPMVMILGSLASRTRRRSDALPFLAAYAAALPAAVMIVEPKLGAARDWDLFAAHAACLTALAVVLIPMNAASPSKLAWAGLVCFLPWLALGTGESAAVSRAASVARGYASYPQAYAFEGLGKYFRERKDPAQAASMYEAAVNADPHNARFHALLGAAQWDLYIHSREAGNPDEGFLELAEASYRKAQTINPNYPTVMDNLAKLLVRKEGYLEAEGLLTRLSKGQPLSVAQLKLLLLCQLRLERGDEAQETYRRILVLDPKADLRQ